MKILKSTQNCMAICDLFLCSVHIICVGSVFVAQWRTLLMWWNSNKGRLSATNATDLIAMRNTGMLAWRKQGSTWLVERPCVWDCCFTTTVSHLAAYLSLSIYFRSKRIKCLDFSNSNWDIFGGFMILLLIKKNLFCNALHCKGKLNCTCIK